MRPIKDIFIEEYWETVYRKITDGKTLLAAEKPSFKRIPLSKQFFCADPFLFPFGGKLYLFTEVFDNKIEKGFLSVSEFDGEKFSTPQSVLTQDTHLSYPCVFERDGEVYMIPETKADGCIELFRATEFPTKWVKEKVIVPQCECIDTVINDGWLITSRWCEENDMSVELCLYREDGTPHKGNPVCPRSFEKRGAGAVFENEGKKIRPAQDCSGESYGNALHFYEILCCDSEKYSEEKIKTVYPADISVEGETPIGMHTYALCGDVEVVDVKFKRFNLKRIFWIIKKKLL